MHNEEHEDDQREQLLHRIAAMKQAIWSKQEIQAAVKGWPSDWQQLVQGRFLMKWFIITGRISGAEEDSLFIFEAKSNVAARAEAERLAWAEVLDPGQSPDEDDEFFLNTVVSCTSKPTILMNQNDSFFVPDWPKETTGRDVL